MSVHVPVCTVCPESLLQRCGEGSRAQRGASHLRIVVFSKLGVSQVGSGSARPHLRPGEADTSVAAPGLPDLPDASHGATELKATLSQRPRTQC